jgi:DNA replication and repair protein RecF
MRIERLTAHNVRNLLDVALEPSPGLNLFQGSNASGKTALLEAIYLLARGRSFRTPRVMEVVRHSAERLQVSARVSHRDARPVMAGIERGPGHLMLRYNGDPVRTVSAHARRFPLVVITPDSQQLVLGGPGARRDWIDWAMFHVEQGYLDHWRDYHRALRQRNHLLKDAATATEEIRGWEDGMARSGTALDEGRRAFLRRLEQAFRGLAGGLWAEPPSLRLRSGWESGVPLEQALADGRRADLISGFTHCGPHRADIDFIYNNNELASHFSRGESKLFICTLMLAEATVLTEDLEEPPVLLVDDFGAELDTRAQLRLLEMLGSGNAQAFVTTAGTAVPGSLPGGSARFHVEHGKIRKMLE